MSLNKSERQEIEALVERIERSNAALQAKLVSEIAQASKSRVDYEHQVAERLERIVTGVVASITVSRRIELWTITGAIRHLIYRLKAKRVPKASDAPGQDRK